MDLKKFKKSFLILGLCFLSFKSNALDIDEKLTCRFLKLSNSKKTVLINRGAEDGLVVGDHAKFFITSGIIARGMVEKVSPSRSIWSLYRVVAPDEMVENKVLNLKIASPVKVTNDPTKSLKEEAIETPTEKTSSKDKETEADLDKINEKMNDDDKKELEDMGVKETKPKSKKAVKKIEEATIEKDESSDTEFSPIAGSNSRTWETFGTLSMNSMSGTVSSTSSTTTATSTSASVFDLSVGLEKYFFSSSTFKNISLFGLVYKRSMEEGDQNKTTTDWFQYGGGVNYHFYNSANQTNKLITYVTGSFGLGTTTVKNKYVTGSTSTEDNNQGTNNFFSVGIGIKYYLSNLGVRALFDYNVIKETFNFADGSSTTRSLNGPRIQVGLSYRFY